MPWKPPTEEEFNDRWFRPLDLLDVTDPRLADETEMWELVEELKAGKLAAVARTAQSGSVISGVEPFVQVMPHHWRRMGDTEELRFWKTGVLVIPVRSISTGQPTNRFERFFDVRIDPDSLSGRPVPSLPAEHEAPPALGSTTGKPPLPDALLNKWAALFNEAYPGASEATARSRLTGMFPDKSVTVVRLRRVLPARPEGRPKQNKDL